MAICGQVAVHGHNITQIVAAIMQVIQIGEVPVCFWHRSAAGHWNMKISATERRIFSDEVTAAVKRVPGQKTGAIFVKKLLFRHLSVGKDCYIGGHVEGFGYSVAGGIGALLVLPSQVCSLWETSAVWNDTAVRGLPLGNAIRFHENAAAGYTAMFLGPCSSEPGMAFVHLSGPLQGTCSQYQVLQQRFSGTLSRRNAWQAHCQHFIFCRR